MDPKRELSEWVSAAAAGTSTAWEHEWKQLPGIVKKSNAWFDVMPSQAKIKDLIDVLPSQAFECRFKFCLIFKAFKILVLVFWLKEHELTSLQDC